MFGLPGDTVFVSKEEIHIGSRTVLKAPLQERDTRGRLVRAAEGAHVLAASECFVLSTYSPRSYDSQYFGPVECTPPFLVLTPVSGLLIGSWRHCIWRFKGMSDYAE